MNRIKLALALIVTFGSLSEKSLKASETLYVSYGSAILSYRINNHTGSLSALSGSPLQIPGWVGSLALHPSGRFLYAETAAGLAGYRIAANGSLHSIPGSPFHVAQGILAFDPLGRFLYAAPGGLSGTLSVYRVNAEGALKAAPGSPFPTGNYSSGITSDPFGRFVYVCNYGGKNVSAFRVLESGSLLSVPGSPFPVPVPGREGILADPISIVTDSRGQFVYVASIFWSSISSFRVGFNGALTFLPTSSVPQVGAWIQSMSIEPTNGFLYATVGVRGLFSYHLNNSTGVLDLVANVITGVQPEVAQADPKGKFVYVANSNHSYSDPGPVQLDGFSIGPKGTVTPVKGSPFMVPVPDGTFPDSIVISPGNSFDRPDRD